MKVFLISVKKENLLTGRDQGRVMVNKLDKQTCKGDLEYHWMPN